MPNTNAPNGFRPARHLSGGTVRLNEYKIASALASDIFMGDIVVLKSDGYLDKGAATDTNIIGVFAGCRWTDTDGTPRFERRWPTGTVTKGSAEAYALVYDDPNTVFEAQCTTGTAFTQTMIGNNADITATAGDTATGQSKHSIAIAGAGAATAQIRILGLIDRPDNALGDAARVECFINEHLLRVTAGI